MTGLRPEGKAGGAGLLLVLVPAVAVLSALALLAGDGNPVFALLPLVAAGGLLLMRKLTLRSMTLLLFVLGLALEGPQDASGRWASPLMPVGIFFKVNLNTSIPISALRFTGFDLSAAILFFLILRRGKKGEEVRIPTARPALRFAAFSAGTVAVLIAFGQARGGDFNQTLWQIHVWGYLLVLFYIFQHVLTSPRDFRTVGRLLIGCALYKAAIAVWVRTTVHVADPILDMPTVTSHEDSMLFAGAVALLMVRAWETGERKHLRNLLLCLPLLLWGMVANNRRLVWVEVAAVVLTHWLFTPASALKRRLVRAMVFALPIIPLYFAAGWNASPGSRLFKPVHMLRTVVDSKSDRSTATRDVENFNLVWTLKPDLLLGTGFGHPYTEFVKGDDISKYFTQYRYIPHNAVLGLWAFGGVAGFTGLWLVLAVGIFLGGRAYRAASTAEHRALAFWSVAMIEIYMAQCYGDMGIVAWNGAFLAGMALVVAGKLAVLTGAWPLKAAAAAPQSAAPAMVQPGAGA